MRFLLTLVVLTPIVLFLVWLLIRPKPVVPQNDTYRNHLGLARWVERQLRDDMVRPLLPKAEQKEGSDLLREFYGEFQHQIGTGNE